MRTVTKSFPVYTFESAPKEVKENIIEYFANDSFLYEHCMSERLDTLKVVANLLYATLDYSLSCVPDRGEYIRFIPKNDELNYQSLWDAINIEKECPLTGMCYDHDFIDSLTKYSLINPNEEFKHKGIEYKVNAGIEEACTNYIQSIHEEYEAMLTEDYIGDLCEVGEYEFTADGELH